jgi:TPR repeat protein
MSVVSIDESAFATAPPQHAEPFVACCLAAAARNELSAFFDLGIAFSTGAHGEPCDLIEAHKWFNLAAVAGHDGAALYRADIAEDMTRPEIAEAQRRAREWLGAETRQIA